MNVGVAPRVAGRIVSRMQRHVHRELLAIGWLGRFRRVAGRAVARLVRTDDLTYASSIAYYALVSLFPVLLLGAFLIGRVTSDVAQRAAVADLILQFFPERVVLVRAQLDALGQASLGIGVAGTVVAAWVSLGVFRAISIAVNHAWGVDEPPSFVRSQVTAFVMLMAAGVALILALGWVSVSGILRSSWFGRGLEAVPALANLSVLPSRYTALVAVTIGVGFVFYVVPNTRVRFRDVWVGAVVTGLLWQLGLTAFSWYLREMSDLSLQGSIATVVTFLFWVYTSAVIFLFGVEFTAEWIRTADRSSSAATP